MVAFVRATLVVAAGLAGAALVCPLCGVGAHPVSAQNPRATSQAPDTSTVRLHISGMFCGSCPTTARLALRRQPGVFSATVTLDDSLGVVRYDPRRVTPARMAADLTRLTGFRATVLPDTSRTPRAPGSR